MGRGQRWRGVKYQDLWAHGQKLMACSDKEAENEDVKRESESTGGAGENCWKKESKFKKGNGKVTG